MASATGLRQTGAGECLKSCLQKCTATSMAAWQLTAKIRTHQMPVAGQVEVRHASSRRVPVFVPPDQLQLPPYHFRT